MTTGELFLAVEEWGRERNIISKENRSRQALKVMEEVGETMEGYFKNASEFVAQAMVAGVSVAGVYMIANAALSLGGAWAFQRYALRNYPGRVIGACIS